MRPREVASETLTLRLSPADVALLDGLVKARAAEGEALGVVATKASVVRALIRAAAASLPREEKAWARE